MLHAGVEVESMDERFSIELTYTDLLEVIRGASEELE